MGKEVVEEVKDELVPPTSNIEEEKEVVKEVVKEKVLEYSVGNVAIQTEPVIILGENQFSIHQALCLLLNKVSKLEKALL